MADHSFQFEMSVQSIFLTIKVWRNQKGLSEAASRRSDNTKVKKKIKQIDKQRFTKHCTEN